MRQIVISGLLVASIGVLLLVGRPALAASSHFTWAVKDQNGNPLGGAVVHVNFKLSSGEWGYAGSCSTNSSGRCSFTLSRKSPCELRGDVEYQGYTGSYSGAYPDGAVITVIIDIPPPPEEGITVTGCVYHPCDPIGPVVGAHVYVLDPTTWEIIAETTTGADGCFTLTSPKSGPGYLLYIDAPNLGISGVFSLPQESGNMGTLELDADCPGPPGPTDCRKEFPNPIDCCPLETEPQPSALAAFLDWVGSVISALIEKIAKIDAWVTVDSNLARSEQLQYDADYFYVGEEKDPRRIALPEEKAEDGIWPGAIARLSPPGYFPESKAARTYHRDKELKWKIPLNELKVGWPVEGDSEAFHPLNESATGLWNWLIRTPEAPVTGTSSSTPSPGETGSDLSLSDVPQIANQTTNSSDCAQCSQSTTSRSRTLGVQLAQADNDVCAFVSVSCTATNWKATCQVAGNCSQKCGHLSLESDPKYIDGKRCFVGGNKCQIGGADTCPNDPRGSAYSIPPGSDSWSITIKGGGDQHNGNWTCIDIISATCSINLDANGNGSCAASAGSPCAGPPDGEALCLPPYPGLPEVVCTEDIAEKRNANISGNIFEWIINLILGRVSVHLKPQFPLLEEIGYYFAGIATERYKDLRNEGIGGVFDAFLPPESDDFPALDANGSISMTYHIKIDWRCFGWEDYCIPGTDPPICWDICIWDPPDLYVRLPIINPEGPLLIHYVGSQTEALRQTQQWLAPPL